MYYCKHLNYSHQYYYGFGSAQCICQFYCPLENIRIHSLLQHTYFYYYHLLSKLCVIIYTTMEALLQNRNHSANITIDNYVIFVFSLQFEGSRRKVSNWIHHFI